MRPSLVALGSLFLIGSQLLAQQTSLNTEVSILKIEPAFVDSPKLSVPGYSKRASGGGRPVPWLEVEVAFDRNPASKGDKYADELTVNYYILLKNETANEDRKPTLLTGSVTHIHVPQEKALHSSIYLNPRTLSKLFDGKAPVNAQQALTDVGVTISDKDGLLAIATLKGTVKGDKGWWDNPTGFTVVPGLLSNKNETPFAPLDWDYFEVIKAKSGN